MKLRTIWIAAASLALLLACMHFAEVRLSILFSKEAFHSVAEFCRSLYPPDFSSKFLRILLRAISQTVIVAVISTLIATVVALPMAVLATSVLWRRGILLEGPQTGWTVILRPLSLAARSVLGVLRAVPELVWALLFVAAIGLGPLPGVLALSVSYIGIMGRIYVDIFDTVEPYSLEALQAIGATRMQIFLRSVWPQALPLVTAYTLYSFECCLRAAAILGFVGAGGIGYEISLSMRLFDYGQVFTLILGLLGLIVAFDILSRPVRNRLRATGKKFNVAGGRLVMRDRSTRLFLLSVAIFGFVVLLGNFDTALALRAGKDALLSGFHFVIAMFPPDLSLPFVTSLIPKVVQTIAVSVTGTLLGVCLGGILAFAATSAFFSSEANRFLRGVRRPIYFVSRFNLSLLRAIPDLVWVMICIVAVGIGAFAGALAIGLHTGGVLGRIYAELFEEVSPEPLLAFKALGARQYQIFLWSIWPQAKRLITSYTILRWDSNVRASTIIGLVGGGGLGQAIFNTVQLGFYRQLTTLVIIVYMLIMLSDLLSNKINAQLQ